MKDFSTDTLKDRFSYLFRELRRIIRTATSNFDMSKTTLALALTQKDYNSIRMIYYRGRYYFENFSDFEILYLLEEVLAKDDQLKV